MHGLAWHLKRCVLWMRELSKVIKTLRNGSNILDNRPVCLHFSLIRSNLFSPFCLFRVGRQNYVGQYLSRQRCCSGLHMYVSVCIVFSFIV